MSAATHSRQILCAILSVAEGAVGNNSIGNYTLFSSYCATLSLVTAKVSVCEIKLLLFRLMSYIALMNSSLEILLMSIFLDFREKVKCVQFFVFDSIFFVHQ